MAACSQRVRNEKCFLDLSNIAVGLDFAQALFLGRRASDRALPRACETVSQEAQALPRVRLAGFSFLISRPVRQAIVGCSTIVVFFAGTSLAKAVPAGMKSAMPVYRPRCYNDWLRRRYATTQNVVKEPTPHMNNMVDPAQDVLSPGHAPSGCTQH